MKKGFAPIWLVIAALIIGAVVFFVLYKKPSLQQQPVESLLKEEYQNPFEEEAQYSNPFEEEYQNPFDGL